MILSALPMGMSEVQILQRVSQAVNKPLGNILHVAVYARDKRVFDEASTPALLMEVFDGRTPVQLAAHLKHNEFLLNTKLKESTPTETDFLGQQVLRTFSVEKRVALRGFCRRTARITQTHLCVFGRRVLAVDLRRCVISREGMKLIVLHGDSELVLRADPADIGMLHELLRSQTARDRLCVRETIGCDSAVLATLVRLLAPPNLHQLLESLPGLSPFLQATTVDDRSDSSDFQSFDSSDDGFFEWDEHARLFPTIRYTLPAPGNGDIEPLSTIQRAAEALLHASIITESLGSKEHWENSEALIVDNSHQSVTNRLGKSRNTVDAVAPQKITPQSSPLGMSNSFAEQGEALLKATIAFSAAICGTHADRQNCSGSFVGETYTLTKNTWVLAEQSNANALNCLISDGNYVYGSTNGECEIRYKGYIVRFTSPEALMVGGSIQGDVKYSVYHPQSAITDFSTDQSKQESSQGNTFQNHDSHCSVDFSSGASRKTTLSASFKQSGSSISPFQIVEYEHLNFDNLNLKNSSLNAKFENCLIQLGTPVLTPPTLLGKKLMKANVTFKAQSISGAIKTQNRTTHIKGNIRSEITFIDKNCSQKTINWLHNIDKNTEYYNLNSFAIQLNNKTETTKNDSRARLDLRALENNNRKEYDRINSKYRKQLVSGKGMFEMVNGTWVLMRYISETSLNFEST